MMRISGRSWLTRLKKQAGIEYVGVASAEDGLRLIKNDGIELILLDLKLTGKMQGLDLLNKLSSKSKVISYHCKP
jgi:DNA-binding response OmpR family regulator